MSEILFIATDPCILALIENLQQLVEPGICLESDYTSGIKRIFDTHPAVVFLQHKIGDVTCDKLANQVKMLLDGVAIPLILLSDESVTSYSVISTYTACFDLCLPLEELSAQVQLLLHTLPEIPWKESAAPAWLPGGEAPDTTLELTFPAGDTEFPLPFPWHEDSAVTGTEAAPPIIDNGTLEALEGNAVSAAERPGASEPERPQLLADFLEKPFAIEPLPLFFEEPHQQKKPAPDFTPVKESSIEQLHRIEKEDPNHLFGSMSEPGPEPLSSPGPIRPRPAGTAPRPAASRSAAPPLKKAQGGIPPSDARRQRASAAEQAEFPGSGELPDAVAARLGIKKEPRYFRATVIGMLLIISLGLLDLLHTLHRASHRPGILPGIEDLETRLKGRRQAAPPAGQQMSQFLPQVAPDPGYPASHPGWERYQSDGLEYLVYREKGTIGAVQVLSQERGAITSAFLKTCIRVSSGVDQFVTKKTEQRSGIQITTGTLQNGGDLAIYRVASSGEIRGFVITSPVNRQAAAPDAKR